jgi:hypothetical protein
MVREMLRIPVSWIALTATSALAVATFTATASPAYAASKCGSGYSAWNGLYVTDVRAQGVGCKTVRKVAQRAHFDVKAVQTRIAGGNWTCVVTKWAAAPVSRGDHRTHVRCSSRGNVVRFNAAS